MSTEKGTPRRAGREGERGALREQKERERERERERQEHGAGLMNS